MAAAVEAAMKNGFPGRAGEKSCLTSVFHEAKWQNEMTAGGILGSFLLLRR